MLQKFCGEIIWERCIASQDSKLLLFSLSKKRGCVSSPLPVHSDVIHDAVFGPTLFNLFVNSWDKIIDHCKVVKYAHDIRVLPSCDKTLSQLNDVLIANAMLSNHLPKTRYKTILIILFLCLFPRVCHTIVTFLWGPFATTQKKLQNKLGKKIEYIWTSIPIR